MYLKLGNVPQLQGKVLGRQNQIIVSWDLIYNLYKKKTSNENSSSNEILLSHKNMQSINIRYSKCLTVTQSRHKHYVKQLNVHGISFFDTRHILLFSSH